MQTPCVLLLKGGSEKEADEEEGKLLEEEQENYVRKKGAEKWKVREEGEEERE